jgi:tetratricopeptide (TPR) repeat protein
MKNQKAIYLIIAFLVVVLSGCDNTEDKKGRFLLKGNEKLKENDTRSALEMYSEALKIDPDYRDARLNRGIVYQRLARLDEAIRDYSYILAQLPEDSLTLFQRGLAYLDNGEIYKSQADAETILESYPEYWKGYFLHGLVQEQFKNHDSALDSFGKALSLEPNNPDLMVNQATIFYYKKNYDEAIRILTKAEQLNPKEANIFNLRSMIAFENKAYEEALDWVEKAIANNPRQAFFYNNRGLYRLFTGDLEKGLDDINYSIKQDPKNLYALRNKGIYYVMKSEKELALRYLEDLYSKVPEMEMVQNYLEKAHAL